MPPPGRGSWGTPWLGVTAAGAVAATIVDAVLLQRRRTYFTGGFLSTDHITSWRQAAGFFFGSLLADFAVIGVIVALAMWALTRLGLGRKSTLILAAVTSFAPIALADFINYQLATFLGDAFDFRLMFDLAGRNPAEIFAVSSSHIVGAVAVLATALALLIGAIVLLRRYARTTTSRLERRSLVRALMLPTGVLAIGVAATVMLQIQSDVIDNGLRRKPSGRVIDAIIAAVSDVDRDGYGLLDRPPDPAPFDARISPWALDVPGNGIDEDGVGGDLPADAPPYVEPETAAAGWTSRQSVVMFGLESFRADVVGASLNGRPVTPVLDALAARGIRLAHAYSHNGYTVQSRRHIFSGSVADLRGPLTLLDDFKANGYQTAYFSGQDESFGGAAGDVGFDRTDVHYDARSDVALRYSTFTTAGSLAVPFDVVVDRVSSFLDKRATDRPLFLYVNFHDTHFPYHHRSIQPLLEAPVLSQFEITPDRAGDVRAMYENTAANVDRAIGVILERARRTLGAEPGVIVLSDHGESLFDEGFLGHGYALNEAQTRIPLIVSNLAARLTEPFGQSDLRDAVRAALAVAGGDRVPLASADPSREVFQYLGAVERPAQIALTRLDGRVIYDFRTRRVSMRGQEWRRPEDLAAADQPAFLNLIRLWERMMVARASSGVN